VKDCGSLGLGFASFGSCFGFVIDTFRLTLLIHSNIELRNNTIVVVLGASGDLAKKKTVGAGISVDGINL